MMVIVIAITVVFKKLVKMVIYEMLMEIITNGIKMVVMMPTSSLIRFFSRRAKKIIKPRGRPK
ncbi:hypothetical protein YC2023_106116 [Brassica napus]